MAQYSNGHRDIIAAAIEKDTKECAGEPWAEAPSDGAHGQDRTADLPLTKGVLYH
jgi:hypothetical protein